MARKKINSDDTEVDSGPDVEIIDNNVDPTTADLTNASLQRFLKLAKVFKLTTRVHVVRVRVKAELFAASNKTRAGEVKKPAHERENIFLTLTNLEDLAVNVAWFGGKLQNAYIGGPRARHSSRKKWMQTAALEEITQCLSQA
jgi:hypothetical protein